MTVGFIIPSGRDLSKEESKAWEFLAAQTRINSKRLRADRLPSAEDLRQAYDIVWWHSDRSPDEGSPPGAQTVSILKEYADRGGSLFLSLVPASFPVMLGFETSPPRIVRQGTWEEESWARDYPDIRGYATYRGHPIFRGMTGGLYSWMPQKSVPFSGAFYEGTLPDTGKVIAVERQYIKVIPSRRITWEYSLPKGRVLCVGTYLFFTEEHPRVRKHLDLFTLNCLSHLTSSRRRAQRTSYWSFESHPPERVDRNSSPLTVREHIRSVPNGVLSIARHSPSGSTGQAFDVGGRRCVIVGDERKGIREAWFHPVRGLQNLRIGLQAPGKSVRWIEEEALDLDIRPDVLVRRSSIGNISYTDHTFSHVSKPAGAVAVKASGAPVRVLVTAEVDLRLMWPFDEHATGALTYAWDAALQGAVVSTTSGEVAAIIGSSLRPSDVYIGACEGLDVADDGTFVPKGTSDRAVRIGFSVDLADDRDALTIVFSGSASSEREAELAYREMMEDPAYVLKGQMEHATRLLSDLTMLHASDRAFTDAYSWALLGTDRFTITTPGIGTSYVAGFGTVDRGWDGGHTVSGRPGYAWYFGRDAVWTAFAALAAGDFDTVRGVLEFLGQHQDVTGKILHELTTSGFAHFDAADATPLYVILMGRYVRASGHRSFARGEFARIRMALDFCASTDTDGDHLIENTNVGHGWVEGGPLFPVHTEHYLASSWSVALKEASFLASVTDHPQLMKRWHEEAEKVRSIVEEEFWDEEAGHYLFGKYADGTYNRERTLLPAVGLSLGIGQGERAEKTLRPFASADFTADWGVRIIGEGNPLFNPRGYHYGSVWPLFTGWAALAEFRHDRPLQGFMHALSTGMTSGYHAAGRVEEVLHGETFSPAGVCHHQAWSDSMVVQPLTEGMLGIDADGFAHTLRLSPWVPPHWSSFRATRIRVGQSWMTFELDRGEQTTSVTLTLEGRQSVAVELALRFPLGTHLQSVTADGTHREHRTTLTTYGAAPMVIVRVATTVKVVYAHTGGIGVLPPSPLLSPGSRSAGLRVVGESYQDGQYVIDIEGIAGTTHELEVIHRGQKLAVHEGAELVETYVSRSKVTTVLPGESGIGRKTLRFA